MKSIIGVGVGALIAIVCNLRAENPNYIFFDEAHTNESEWAFVNIKFYNNKVNNAYLSSSGSIIASPLFSNSVIRVEISFMAASVSTHRLMKVVPLDGSGNEIESGMCEFVPPLEKGVAEVAWPAEAGVRQFKIGADTGDGNIHVYDCLVALAGADGAPSVPCGLENRKVTGSSFVAAWRACEGAESYLVDLYRVDRIGSSWSGEPWREDFADAVNTTGNPVQIRDIPALFPQLEGERLYIPARTNGLVQIGTGDKAGHVALVGCPAAEGRAVRFRAKRYKHKDEGSVMPLLWTDGGETNAFASVELADEMSDYEVPLDGVPSGAVVLLHSTTNRSTGASARGRVWLDSVSVVSGYTPAQVATNAVAEGAAALSPMRKFSGLCAGTPYLWRVRSVRGEAASEPSALMEVVPEGEREKAGTAVFFR